MSNFLHDNQGNKSSPTPESSQPNAVQAAQKLTQATAGTATTAAVTAGQKYRFTCQITGGFVFGLATVATGSEANIRWACPLGKTIEIKIPVGYTTLHYTTDTDSAVGYLVELVQ